MKKSTKGAVACGAAALILAGGAGSMAAWTSSTTGSTSQTAKSGHLTVSAVSTPVWKWKTTASGNVAAIGTTFDPSTQTLSPGDSVQVTGTFTVGVQGTNLKAAATVTNATAGTLPTGLSFTSDALAPGASNPVADVTSLTPADNGKTIAAGGVLAFNSSASDSTTMDQTINVSGLALTITQK